MPRHCKNCNETTHYITTCPKVALVPIGQAKRGMAAQDRENKNHEASKKGTKQRKNACKTIHCKKGKSSTKNYETGDLRKKSKNRDVKRSHNV